MSATAATTPYTRILSDFALNIRLEEVPAAVKHEACRIFLDSLGTAVAGLATPAGRIAMELAKDERGPLQATLVGAGQASLMPVAFANTVLANALDFEAYGPAEGHVCAAAAPTALAMAEAVDASGKELLAGLIAGLEIGGRIGPAIRRSGRGSREEGGGVRGHGHVVFAAAAEAGRILQLTPDQMHHAFGIAGYSANVPTLTKYLSSPYHPMTKYDHLGLMAQAGVQAALLAQRGFTGDLDILEGEPGFWRLSGAPSCGWDYLTRDLGSSWAAADVWHKAYPVNIYANPSVDLVCRLVRENEIPLADIDRIEVRTARAGREPHKEIRDPQQAMHNLGYNLSAALFDIRPRRSWQEPHNYRREDLLTFMRKIHFTVFREGEVTTRGDSWAGWSPARATVQAGGRVFEGGTDYLLKLTDEDLKAKFYDNVGGLLRDADATELERQCWNLQEVARARQLAAHLRVQRPA